MESIPDSTFELHEPLEGFSLRLSRCAKDVQRKKINFLNLQNTVAEASFWMGTFGVRSVPVVAGSGNPQTIASLQVIDAKTLLHTLLERIEDPAFTLGDFFALSLSEFTCRRVPIVYPQMDLAALIRRMYSKQQDLLLVFEGIQFSGLVTIGDIFDAMIGMAVLDNALFNTDLPKQGSIVENARICCLKQKLAFILDHGPVYQLSVENTILTALRIVLNQPSHHLLLSDQPRNLHQLVTAENILSALLCRREQAASSTSLRSELMCPLSTIFDIKPLNLAPDSSVFEAVQAIHFNDLNGSPVLSDQQQLKGVITINSLLKAFLDSIDRACMMIQDD